jgi:hypothetical protein
LIRASAIILLTLIGIIASIPLAPAHPSLHGIAANYQSSPSDPSLPTTAFNYTYSQANLYTNSSVSTLSPSNTTGTKLTWFSTVNRTSTNAPISGTAFNFNITKANLAQAREEVNWTLTVPQFNCQTCNSVTVDFNFFGNLTKGTNATYTLSLVPPNSTVRIISANYTSIGTFPPAPNVNCPEQSCIDVTKYRGYHVNLAFMFGWNGTNNPGMFASVGEVLVSSIGGNLQSSSNVMQQDPTNSSRIDHTATLSDIHYNNTLTTYVQPGNVSTTQLWWSMEVMSIYYPAGYRINQVSLNGTQEYPSVTRVPFEMDNCFVGTNCSVSLLALNVTDFSNVSVNSTMTIIAYTKNSITELSTVSGGVATQIFTSGDQIGVKVVNMPSVVNASATLQTGTLTISFNSTLSIPLSTFSTATGGTYNFTLPTTCGSNNQLCNRPFTVTAVFASGYDLGNATASFSIDLLQVSLTGTGGGNGNTLSVSGTLDYGNGNPASGINATLFAIDRGTHTNSPYTNYAPSPHPSNRLYISNVTLVNGVFTQGQSLIILFTIVNPNATQAFNATLTIAHDWPGPQAHNMATSVYLGLNDTLGDFAITNATARTFQATISFTGTGVQVDVKSLFTQNQLPNALTMTAGTSPVLPNAPHAGLFNFTITSMINNRTQSSPNTIFSPAYAYVSPSFAPSRYLYSSPQAFTTGSNGGFSQTITNPRGLLGAENLTVFVLARDSSGVVVMNVLPNSIFSQSTALIASADSIGPIAKGQSATATLHLKSNSTLANGITEALTIDLVVQGNGITPVTVTGPEITIAPGQSQTVQISFTAPSNIGPYTLTFTSPEYGGVLTSQTVQVTITSGLLQYLLPAAIGVIAAIIILGVYLMRGRESAAEEAEAAKPKGPSPKPKPATGPSTPAKSLTYTGNNSQ